MLILTHFHKIVGPTIFLTSPYTLLQELDEEHANLIKSMLESDINGFFTHYFSPDFKTANIILSLNSRYARGLQEIIMITAILSEQEPNYKFYEKMLTKLVKNLQDIPEMYKAFYINSGRAKEDKEIQENFRILKQELDNTYKIISVKNIETEGHILSFQRLKEQKDIKLSENIIDKLSELTKKKENCFLVFRAQNKVLKLDIIPVEADKDYFKLEIIFGVKMTIKVLQEVTQILTEYKKQVSLVFTSGVCQEMDKCVYEAYIDTDPVTLEMLREKITKISGVISIETQHIEVE